MKCTDARSCLLLDDSGELPEADRPGLAAHLEECAACRTWSGNTRRILAASQAALQPAAEPRPETLQRILQEAAAAHRPRTQQQHWTLPRPAFHALRWAALLTLLLGAWWIFQPRGHDAQRLANLDTLLALATSEATPAATEMESKDGIQIETLAARLLQVQGLGLEEDELAEVEPTAPAELPATDPLSDRTSASRPGRCV